MKKTLFTAISILIVATLDAQTWNQDIAPIVYEHCGKCHHDGGIAPHSFVDYATAADFSADIDDAVSNNIMPPWPADETYQHFIGENVLSQSQIDAIHNWVSAGAPEGTGSAPTVPSYNDGYLVTSPDEIVSIPAYNVSQDIDEYRTFVIPSTSANDRYIGSVEFEPGNDDIVHHILAFYDPSNVSQQLDDAAAGPGFPSNGGSFPSDEAVLIGVWVPGMGPTIFPENLAIPLPGGADFVFEVHYAPGSLAETADVQMRLKYKTDAVIREVYHDPLLFHGWPSLQVPLHIPANSTPTFHETSDITPVDLSFLSVFPHMHLLGKTFKVFGVTTANDSIPFINVDNYEFHWQFSYTFPTLKKLPLGSRLHGYASYDNTENNEENPNSPPQDVNLGENTTDEMMVCFFMYTLYQPGDENMSLVQVQENVAEAQSALFVFPNPANENLLVDIPNNIHRLQQVYLTDMTGKTISCEYEFSSGRMMVDLNGIASGIYQIHVMANGKMMSSRFMKK